jgi:hypothetical protein
MRNPTIAQKKFHYASLAYLTIRERMEAGTPITYKELHDEIGSPWRWHGNEFSDLLAMITVIDPQVAEYVTLKATGRTAVRQEITSELYAEYKVRARDLDSAKTINDYERETEALLSA